MDWMYNKRKSNDVTGQTSGYQKYATQYTVKSSSALRIVYLQIEKVPKEKKYRTTATPLIRLFCKSMGRCAS